MVTLERELEEKIRRDRWDYQRFLAEYRLTEEKVQQLMAENREIQMHYERIALEASPIHGLGYFARQELQPHFAFAIARCGITRTSAGRYINHSSSPNTVFVLHVNWDLYAVSTRTIMEGEEVTVDYRQAARLVQNLPRPDEYEVHITSLGPQEQQQELEKE